MVVAGLILFSISVGVLFVDYSPGDYFSSKPVYRFFSGIGIALLLLGCGGVFGRVPNAIIILAKKSQDIDEIKSSLKEIVIYSTSLVLGATILLFLLIL